MTAAQRVALRAEAERRLAAKAMRDSTTFCAAYRPKVAHPVHGEISFAPWQYQRDLLAALDRGGPIIVLKGRQIGISTTVMMHAVRLCQGTPQSTVVTISVNQDKAAELNRTAKIAIEGCQPALPSPVMRSNSSEIEFANGSRIKTQPATVSTARGLAGSRIIFDEFAFYALQEQMWRAAMPAASRGQGVVVISTPDMEGDRFADLWQQSQAPGSAWTAFRLPWTVCPEYGDDWRDANRPHYTQAEWASEFECEFLGAGSAVFPTAAIEQGVALWPQVADRVPSRWAHGVDVAGEGRDETVQTDVDCTAYPWAIREQHVWAQIPAPVLQAALEATVAQTHGKLAIDYTGVGYGVAQNLGCQHLRVVFTGGRDVTGDARQQNVPRHALLTNAVGVLERGELALDPANHELLRALRTARWGEKRLGNFVDRLDSALLALWAERKQRTTAFAIPKYSAEKRG